MSSVAGVTCAQVKRLELSRQLDEMADQYGRPLNWTKVKIELQDGRKFHDFLPKPTIASLVAKIPPNKVTVDILRDVRQVQPSEESADAILTRLFKQRSSCAIL